MTGEVTVKRKWVFDPWSGEKIILPPKRKDRWVFDPFSGARIRTRVPTTPSASSSR